jgi:hypothetical protein
MFGADSASSGAAPKSNELSSALPIKSRIPDGPSKSIEVPFEIVVVCDREGLVVHPGGYRISTSSLQEAKKKDLLTRELVGVVQQRASADPTIRPQPRVKFLVESSGSPAFWAARKQVLFSGLGWPMSLQVTGSQDVHPLGQETW